MLHVLLSLQVGGLLGLIATFLVQKNRDLLLGRSMNAADTEVEYAPHTMLLEHGPLPACSMQHPPPHPTLPTLQPLRMVCARAPYNLCPCSGPLFLLVCSAATRAGGAEPPAEGPCGGVRD